MPAPNKPNTGPATAAAAAAARERRYGHLIEQLREAGYIVIGPDHPAYRHIAHITTDTTPTPGRPSDAAQDTACPEGSIWARKDPDDPAVDVVERGRTWHDGLLHIAYRTHYPNTSTRGYGACPATAFMTSRHRLSTPPTWLR